MKELITRILVALIGIPVLVFCIWQGGIWFFLLIVIISGVGQYEFYKLARAKGALAQYVPGLALSLVLLYTIAYGLEPVRISVMILLLMFIMAYEMFRNNGSPLLNAAVTLLGVFYPAFFLGMLLYLRLHFTRFFETTGDPIPAIFVLTMFISVWICDTMAYFAGVTLGRHRLFPRVSPKKSIEGAVAGLAGAVLTFLALGWLELVPFPPLFLVLSGAIVGILGQGGDLVESWLKRDANVKDSSHVLPGHGGFLDRFDSLSFISPAFLVLFLLWS